MGQVSISIIKKFSVPQSWFLSIQSKQKETIFHQILDILGFGGDEGGGDAAVKRQAEGFANPMYQLANLMGQVIMTIMKKIDRYKYQKCATEQRKYFGDIPQN